jgi:hypothetical protein
MRKISFSFFISAQRVVLCTFASFQKHFGKNLTVLTNVPEMNETLLEVALYFRRLLAATGRLRN